MGKSPNRGRPRSVQDGQGNRRACLRENKEMRGFRRLNPPVKQNVRREWKMVCAIDNLLKLHRADRVAEMI